MFKEVHHTPQIKLGGVPIMFLTHLNVHYFGYQEGRKHDAGMLADSGLLNDLQRYAFSPTGQAMCLYGDPAYPLRIHLQAPFRNAVLTFNSSMSTVRESVEWLFSTILNSWISRRT